MLSKRKQSRKHSLKEATKLKSESLLVINNSILDEGTEIPEERDSEPVGPSSRTALLIQDYREFKAARSIQRFACGWLYRTKYRRKLLAAIKIQTEWRRFYCQRQFFLKVEQHLQKRIEEHFYRAARKIQALWRGWWVRHHVHDHSRLVNLQLLAGEDLLYCVAYKLHHLLRTHHIPGVFSLSNSNAYSKVEQLLNSLKFKTYNIRALKAKEERKSEYSEAKRQHQKAAFSTEVPFSAQDANGIQSKCSLLKSTKDADLRMSIILRKYEEANREPCLLRLRKIKENPFKQFCEIADQPSTFCGDVVESMKKWKIIQENKLTVDENIFKEPQNLENFLKEVESKMSILQGNCYCRREFVDELNREKAKYAAEENEQKRQISCRKQQVSIHDSLSMLKLKLV